jgi:hypothetical protein
VTVHDSPAVKLVSGSSVNVVGPPPGTAVWAPLVAQWIVYQPVSTLTPSLKVTEMFASAATPLAPAAGDRASTDGASSAPQTWNGDAVLRGVGAPTTKSFRLLSVSMQPLPLRRAALVLLRFPVGDPSEQFAVVP